MAVQRAEMTAVVLLVQHDDASAEHTYMHWALPDSCMAEI